MLFIHVGKQSFYCCHICSFLGLALKNYAYSISSPARTCHMCILRSHEILRGACQWVLGVLVWPYYQIRQLGAHSYTTPYRVDPLTTLFSNATKSKRVD